MSVSIRFHQRRSIPLFLLAALASFAACGGDAESPDPPVAPAHQRLSLVPDPPYPDELPVVVTRFEPSEEALRTWGIDASGASLVPLSEFDVGSESEPDREPAMVLALRGVHNKILSLPLDDGTEDFNAVRVFMRCSSPAPARVKVVLLKERSVVQASPITLVHGRPGFSAVEFDFPGLQRWEVQLSEVRIIIGGDPKAAQISVVELLRRPPIDFVPAREGHGELVMIADQHRRGVGLSSRHPLHARVHVRSGSWLEFSYCLPRELRMPGETPQLKVSVATDGTQADYDCKSPAISADGRCVAFESLATTLVPPDPGYTDVFLHDRDTDENGTFDEPGTVTTIRVSADDQGTRGNAQSDYPAISADGRYVAFHSYASNLVGGDTNAQGDVFVRDRDTDEDGIYDEGGAVGVIRVSRATDGTQGNGDSAWPAISEDGRYVAFQSEASNLVANDTNNNCGSYPYDNCRDIFVRDRDSDGDAAYDEAGQAATTRVSLASDGTQAAYGDSSRPSISADGRYVAFDSAANNLVSGDTNGEGDVFWRDTHGGSSSTRRVSVTSGPYSHQATGGDSWGAAISPDGRYVAFHSMATNLATGDTNGAADVFVARAGLAP